MYINPYYWVDDHPPTIEKHIRDSGGGIMTLFVLMSTSKYDYIEYIVLDIHIIDIWFLEHIYIYLQPPCALFLHAFHEIWHHMQKDHLFSKSAVICKRHIFWLWPFFQVEISSNVWWFDSINEFPKPSSPLQGTTPPKISKHSKWLH